MPFEAYKIYQEYEPDKYKTSTQEKVAKALAGAEKAGLRPLEVGTEWKEVQELFGKDFLGPEALKKTWGVDLTEEELQEIEHIPFSQEDLEKAKELGMMLVLRLPHNKEQKPLTIKQMRETFSQEDPLGDPQKKKSRVVWNQDWYNDEDFATKTTPKLGWGLVTKEVLAESKNKNWDEQQEVLEKWASDNGIDPKTIHRRTPVEVAFDTITYYGANQDSLLESSYDWTSVRSSDGKFVFVGYFDSGGLRVSSAARGNRYSALGVCPAR